MNENVYISHIKYKVYRKNLKKVIKRHAGVPVLGFIDDFSFCLLYDWFCRTLLHNDRLLSCCRFHIHVLWRLCSTWIQHNIISTALNSIDQHPSMINKNNNKKLRLYDFHIFCPSDDLCHVSSLLKFLKIVTDQT